MGRCISCDVRREFAKRGLRFVRIVFLVAALLFAAYLVAGAGWVGYHFLRDYVGAVHSLLNPTILSNGTPSAKSYVGSLKTSVAIISSNPAAISCTIRNVGRRSIRQMMVQINLRDDNGNILTWRQGPVIRGYYQEEEGIMQGASHTSQQPNSFSKFWAP